MQTLAIMFTGVPIPFAKPGGMFSAGGPLGSFLADLKRFAKNKADAAKSFFAESFINPLREKILPGADGFLSSPFNDINQWFDENTSNNFAGLEASLPYLFSNSSPSIVAAKNDLLARIGKVSGSQSEYRIGPFTLGELSNVAEDSVSLARSLREMEQHADNLCGLGGDDIRFSLQRIYGNVEFTGATVNIASSNAVTPNLSSSAYPVVNIGDIIVINTQPRVVLSRTFTPTVSGNVSVNIASDNVRVTTASLSSLNLANCLLSTGSTLLLSPGHFISINNEIRQVHTINAVGDSLTVTLPFYNSTTAQVLQKETSFNVNTNFTSTLTNQNIHLKTSFTANSLCLDNVITGRGTTFTSSLSANDRIFYDNQEYMVSGVTDTTITIGDEDWLRDTSNFPVYKIVGETPYLDLTEDLVDPDGILTAFTLPGQILGDETYLNGLQVRVRRADGSYAVVDASKPTDAAQTLFQKELLRRSRDILNQMKNDLRDDALRSLTSSQVVTQISGTINRLAILRSNVENIVNQDIAVYNQVKSIVKGMLRLFSLSCSKKKRKDNGGNPTDSDDYLSLILKPNAGRQGCSANTSDFIGFLDDFDLDYNDPNTSSNNRPVLDTTIPPTNLFDGFGSLIGPFPRQPGAPEGGDVLGGGIDNQDPNVNVPEDPCAKPC